MEESFPQRATQQGDGRAMGVAEFVRANRKEILRIARKHGAANVRVFGSAATGELAPDSDIDLIVDVLPEHSAWFPGGLLADLEELLGRQVDVVEPDGLHWYIRDQVLKEAVPL